MTRDLRTIAAPADRVGAVGHPGLGRTEHLYPSVTPALRKLIDQELDENPGKTITDIVGEALADRYYGPLNKPTPEQIAESKILTPVEAVAHLDPTLRGDFSREELITHFESIADKEPLTLEVLEAEEDKAVERLYLNQLDIAEQRATPTKGDPMGPRIKGDVNHARYKEEIEIAKQRKAREDRARARRREQRRHLLLVAAMMVAPKLRVEGDPRLQRQYEARSHWATMGGYSRRAVAEANKDTS